MKDIMNTVTEAVNQKSICLDLMSNEEIIRLMINEDRKIPDAIEKEIPNILKALELIINSLQNNGRLIYIGAGTSGRLGVLDAVECRPTFGVADEQVQALLAGGERAMFHSVEFSEDNREMGRKDIAALKLTPRDVLVGITASGSTPYVLSTIMAGKELGAKTVGVTCNENSKLEAICDSCISVVVGPEILNGSTRLKAGTAEKIVLNMISTVLMINLGKVYQNLMVDMIPSNVKLKERAIRQIAIITGVNEAEIRKTFQLAGGNIKVTIMMLKLGLSAAEAQMRLTVNHGLLRKALGESARK
ncbi:MAG: N-acetylmuramic acid 6-phosphate etherase [Bacillota bacterium]|jgi:N-acetylmuramic acid 6-phosphate etherase